MLLFLSNPLTSRHYRFISIPPVDTRLWPGLCPHLPEYPPPQRRPLSLRGGDDLPGQGGVLHLSRRPAGQQQRRLLLREGPARSLREETQVCQTEAQDVSGGRSLPGRYRREVTSSG